MKNLRLWAVVVFALLCAGCDVLTTAQLPVTHDDRVVGEWKDGQGQTLTVRRDGDEYLAGDAEDFAKKKATRFTLSKVGRLTIVQTQEGVGGPCVSFGKASETCRTVYGAIEIGQDQIVVRPLDSSRLMQDSLGRALKIAHQIRRAGFSNGKGDNAVFFDAGSRELLTFLETYLPGHPLAFRRSGTLTYRRAL